MFILFYWSSKTWHAFKCNLGDFVLHETQMNRMFPEWLLCTLTFVLKLLSWCLNVFSLYGKRCKFISFCIAEILQHYSLWGGLLDRDGWECTEDYVCWSTDAIIFLSMKICNFRLPHSWRQQSHAYIDLKLVEQPPNKGEGEFSFWF